MKKIRSHFLALIVLTMVGSCSAQGNEKEKVATNTKTGDVDVYYFHYTLRCATCNAVESVSKDAIATIYGDKVSFIEYNLDEPEGEAVGKDLGVSGQTLLIVSGSTKINLTNEGFMNARSNPEKLKHIIKEKIDPLL